MSAATLPSGRHPTVPETNTRFPLRTPEEYSPIGCATEAVFLRRFLLHIVPDGFVRIRHFGLLANCRRRAALAQCRALLAQPSLPPARPESVRDLMLRLTGLDIERCPVCD